MQRVAIQIIRDEHMAISAILYSLRFLTRRIRVGGEAPDFRLLHAMLDYIVEYPDRWHHPKESEYLFTALRERDASAGELVDDLEEEHQRGDERIEGLKKTLTEFERNSKNPAPFAEAVEDYARFQWEHIRKEEDVLMPLAERALTDDDWRRIARAFGENDNPLYGIRPKDEAERLYQKILSIAPPPIGYRTE